MKTPCLFRLIPRCDPKVLESLREFSVAELQDALDPEWRPLALMSPAMKPTTPDVSILGLAVTAFCPPGDNLMMHCGLHVTKPGDVLVVSNGGVPNGALWGDNAAMYAAKKGVAGVVIDGPSRDTDALRRLRFPIWSTSISVSTPAKAKLGSVNMPIQCDGIVVYPGDIIVADGDGVIALRPSLVGPVVERARARAEKDAALQSAIAAGLSIFEFAKMDLVLKELDAEFKGETWVDAANAPGGKQ